LTEELKFTYSFELRSLADCNSCYDSTVSVKLCNFQPEEEKAARGPYKCLQISEGWVSGGWGQALFSGAQ